VALKFLRDNPMPQAAQLAIAVANDTGGRKQNSYAD